MLEVEAPDVPLNMPDLEMSDPFSYNIFGITIMVYLPSDSKVVQLRNVIPHWLLPYLPLPTAN